MYKKARRKFIKQIKYTNNTPDLCTSFMRNIWMCTFQSKGAYWYLMTYQIIFEYFSIFIDELIHSEVELNRKYFNLISC